MKRKVEAPGEGGEGQVFTAVQSPYIWCPVGVGEATTKGEEARGELLQVGEGGGGGRGGGAEEEKGTEGVEGEAEDEEDGQAQEEEAGEGEAGFVVVVVAAAAAAAAASEAVRGEEVHKVGWGEREEYVLEHEEGRE